MTKLKNVMKNFINSLGYDIRKYNVETSHSLRRKKLFKKYNINVVLDIGANLGQYATILREFGYENKIISFEPISFIYNELKNNSSKDDNWEAVQLALGNFDGETIINISKNNQSNSILNILPSHINISPNAEYISKEKIKVNRLDTVIENYCDINNDKIFLKIDSQGYEKYILEGASNSLTQIKGIQLEMSLKPLYENEMVFEDMIIYLKRLGFSLMSIEIGLTDKNSGEIFQVDGIFFKSDNKQAN